MDKNYEIFTVQCTNLLEIQSEFGTYLIVKKD